MKERILGKTVGKAGVSQVLIVKTIFIAVICIILGFFLVISSLVNWGKSYFEFLFWIGLFVVAFVPIQFLRLKMEKNLIGKYFFYENGFEDVLKKRKIFFEDVANYFYLNLKNGSDDMEFIVIELKNNENLTKPDEKIIKFDKNKINFEKITINLKLNRAVSKLFVKNYVEFILKNKFCENKTNICEKDNLEFKFGIIEEINSVKDKIFSLNMDKNLEKIKISEYIFLNKDGIRLENQESKILKNECWNKISGITVFENKKNKNIQIENKNGEIIFFKNIKLLEKPELFIKLVEKYSKFDK